jgi:hypothetical protein
MTTADHRVSAFLAAPHQVAENIAYGAFTPREIVLGLVVDDGVPGRGHRKNIFAADAKLIGVGVGLHHFSAVMATVTFDAATPPAEKPGIDALHANRRKRLVAADFPPSADIHIQIKTATCAVCGGTELGCKHNINGPPGFKVHKACDCCAHCGKGFAGNADATTHSAEKRPAIKECRVHHQCLGSHFDMGCYMCGSDCWAMGGAYTYIGENFMQHYGPHLAALVADGKTRQAKGAAPRLDYDLVCGGCKDVVAAAHGGALKARNEAAAKQFAAQEAVERAAMTCHECKKVIDGTPLLVAVDGVKVRYHMACYDTRSAGACHHCGKDVGSLDPYVEQGGHVIHDGCIAAYDAARRASPAKKPSADADDGGSPGSAKGSALSAVREARKAAGGDASSPAKADAAMCGQCEKPAGSASTMHVEGKGWVHSDCYAAATSKPCKHCGGITVSGGKEAAGAAKTGQVTLPNNAGVVHSQCVAEYMSKQAQSGAAPPVAASSASASSAGCPQCNKTIDPSKGDAPVNFNGKRFCGTACFEASMAVDCAQCAKPIAMSDGTSEVDGKKFHGACVGAYLSAKNSSPKPSSPKVSAAATAIAAAAAAAPASNADDCPQCNKTIDPSKGDSPVNFNGKRFCGKACFEASMAVDCAHCAKPIAMSDGTSEVEGKKFHGACVGAYLSAKSSASSSAAPRATVASSAGSGGGGAVCNVCDKAIVGEPALHADGKVWHGACRNKAQQCPCDYCDKMILKATDKSTVVGTGVFHGDCVSAFFGGGRKKKNGKELSPK